jgi:hypothetical protein
MYALRSVESLFARVLEKRSKISTYRVEKFAKELLMEDECERPKKGLQEGGPKKGHFSQPHLAWCHTLHDFIFGFS